jgi:Protein of unknown function (DUF4236)
MTEEIPMGFGFRRRSGLFGGLVHLNASKHGLGLSLGVPGARVGVNALGKEYFRAGIPGTGLFYNASLSHHHNKVTPLHQRVGFFPAITVLASVVGFLWLIHIS